MTNPATEPPLAPTHKGGGISLTFAIIFLLLLLYPVIAVLLRDYESDMAMTTVFLGTPCFILGNIASFIGLVRGHRRCILALALMWIPLALLILLGIIVSALH